MKKKLTEREWERVFDIRCKSKRGERVSEEDMKFVERAWLEDPDRYGALNAKVFEATKPLGSR